MPTSPSLPDTVLVPFGFTELESRLYCELLKQPNATGYRLARAIGKATANTYQGLANLVRKGAILEDDTDPKSFRPVSPADLFSTLRRSFDTQATDAETALEQVFAPATEDRLYQLKHVEQTFTRARHLIDGAERILLFDLFPGPFDRLRDALEAAHARGVLVGGLVYGALEGAAFTHVLSTGADFVSERWPGQQMSLVADSRESLIALLSLDGKNVAHGFWSDSVYLSCMNHNGLAAELRLAAMKTQMTDPLARFSLLAAQPPGLAQLIDGH